MDKHSIDVLEFGLIKERVSGFACSEPGKRLCEQIAPWTDKGQIEHSLSELNQFREAISSYGRVPIAGLRDIGPILLMAAQTCDCLDVHDFLEFLHTLGIIKEVFGWLKQVKDVYPVLEKYWKGLDPLDVLKKRLDSCFEASGEVKDNATPELAKIRKQLHTSKEEIMQILERIIRDSGNHDILQDDFITIRNDRYVIPVKTTKKGGVEGIVHDESGSGATIFIEPIASLEAQNRYKRLKVKEKEEIKRLFFELTGLVAGSAEALRNDLDILAQMDCFQAKALFCSAINGRNPVISDQKWIKLLEARHPLLIFRHREAPDLGCEPMPIDIEIGGETRALVISGPNTGGKTVTIKMVGIILLMVQAGLQVPVAEGSEIGVFEDVLADIGDEQDIALNLSSFSSHVQNMVRIMEGLTQGCIVLLDELGSDTNPTEGAALGVAIMESILKKGALCIVTTHHNVLKAYAITHSSEVKNASMGFDPERMVPTYKLHIGYPGSSNALGVCTKLGMPQDILETAKKVMGEGEVKLERLLFSLEQQEERLKEERERQKKIREDMELIRGRYNTLKEDIEKRRAKINQQAGAMTQDMVKEARREIEQAVTLFRKSSRPQTVDIKKAHEQLKDIEKKASDVESRFAHSGTIKIEELAVGQPVFVPDLKEEGVVSRIDPDEGRIWVMVGQLRLQVKAQNLAPSKGGNRDATPPLSKPLPPTYLLDKEVSPRLMVIGRHVEEALLEIDKYIDDALLASLTEVSIIHGKGTGALQRAIREFLSSHPQVPSFRYGVPEEGGTGITIVKLAT